MHVQDKHETRKREILENAFRIWGESGYSSTSLSGLAGALGMTKQALYRYFSSKESLEQAMEDLVIDRYLRFSSRLADKAAASPADEIPAVYVAESMTFLRDAECYMAFLSFRYRKSESNPPAVADTLARVEELLRSRCGLPPTAMRYLNSLVFLASHQGRGKRDGAGDVDRVVRLFREGFCVGQPCQSPDFDQVLSDAAMLDYGLDGVDPVIKAVFEAVLEESSSGISVDMVARKAGMTKSSLYNYWPGKEAMLADVLARQFDLFQDRFSDFVGSYDRPADRLFAYPAYTGAALSRNPGVINYIQRVMAYGSDIKAHGPLMDQRYAGPIGELVADGCLAADPWGPRGLLGLLNLAVVMEIQHHLARGSVRIRINQGIKDIYRLFAGGTEALRRTLS